MKCRRDDKNRKVTWSSHAHENLLKMSLQGECAEERAVTKRQILEHKCLQGYSGQEELGVEIAGQEAWSYLHFYEIRIDSLLG